MQQERAPTFGGGSYNGSAMASLSTLVEIDVDGIAWVASSGIKVVEVVLDKLAYGWSPEEIQFQHPGLSLAQIYAALSYYYENKASMDAEIARQRREVEHLAAAHRQSPLYQKLLALKNE